MSKSNSTKKETKHNDKLTSEKVLKYFGLDPSIYEAEPKTSSQSKEVSKKYEVDAYEWVIYRKSPRTKISTSELEKMLKKVGKTYNKYAVLGKEGIVPFVKYETINNAKGTFASSDTGPGGDIKEDSSDIDVGSEHIEYEVTGYRGDDEKLVKRISFAYLNLLRENYEDCGMDLKFDNENPDNQKILYKNRLVKAPIYFGQSYDGEFPGLGMPLGPCPFKGKTDAEKFEMCRVKPGMTPAQAKALGVIEQCSFPQSSGKASLPMNKYIAQDFAAICQEILNLGFFKLYVGNAFRTAFSAGGKSRHQIGCAVDINPGQGGNPWFATRINKGDPEPAIGSTPWSIKQCPYRGGYDRNKCVWHWGHPVVQIFLNHGWGWGGSYGDVMHFSLDGR